MASFAADVVATRASLNPDRSRSASWYETSGRFATGSSDLLARPGLAQSHTPTLAQSHTLSLTHSHSRSLSRLHTPTLAHSHTLSDTHSHSRSVTHSPLHTPTGGSDTVRRTGEVAARQTRRSRQPAGSDAETWPPV